MSLQTTTKPQRIGEWPRHAKVIAMATADESDDRLALQCVHLTRHFAEATDGKVWIRCYHQPMDEATDLLLRKSDMEIIQLLGERFAAETSSPDCYLVKLDEGTFGFATDRAWEGFDDKVTVRYTANSLPGRYPDVEAVVPSGTPIAQVEIRVDMLHKMACLLFDACDREPTRETVVLSIYGNEKPIRFFLLNPYQSEEIEGLIMPTKADDASKKRLDRVTQARIRAGLGEKL